MWSPGSRCCCIDIHAYGCQKHKQPWGTLPFSYILNKNFIKTTASSLQFHLVPKYKSDEFEWGTPFAMNPGRKYLTEAEYAAMIQKIKDNL